MTQQMEELFKGNHDLLALNESLKSEIMALQNAGEEPSVKGGSAKEQEDNNHWHAEMVIELNEQIEEYK